MNPIVISLEPLEDYTLEIEFDNGEVRIFDIKPYLNKGAFTQLKDHSLFKAVQVEAGSLEWPNGIGLCYDTVYLESVQIEESFSSK